MTSTISRVSEEFRARYATPKQGVALCWMYSKDNPNFGDEISPWLVEKITKHPPSRVIFGYKGVHVVAIGTVIDKANSKSIVWGAGGRLLKKPKTIAAVRGPITKKSCDEMGVECPEIYGDPAILCPLFYAPKIKNTKKYVIVPHVCDYEVVSSWYENDKDVKVLDLRTRDIERTIDEIASAKLVISSSLHGVVVATSYGIPCVWAMFQSTFTRKNPISTDKFVDYLAGVNAEKPYVPVVFCNERIVLEDFTWDPFLVRVHQNDIAEAQSNLLEVFPAQ